MNTHSTDQAPVTSDTRTAEEVEQHIRADNLRLADFERAAISKHEADKVAQEPVAVVLNYGGIRTPSISWRQRDIASLPDGTFLYTHPAPTNPAAQERAEPVAPAVGELLATFAEWARQVSERKDVPTGIRKAAIGLCNAAARLSATPPAPAQPSPESKPEQAEAPKDAERWADWVAGMVGSYLGFDVDDKRNAAIAGIIKRRLWGLPPATLPPAIAAGEREITDAMVDAYLTANAEYWQEVDTLPADITKPWRQGTPKEATRVSLRAALATKPQAPSVVLSEENTELLLQALHSYASHLPRNSEYHRPLADAANKLWNDIARGRASAHRTALYGDPALDEMMRASHPTPTPQAEQSAAQDADANLFWNDADPEVCQSSIHDVIDREWCDGILKHGDVMEIQRAVRLPNIKVRLIPSAEDGEDYFDFEVIDAAIAVNKDKS